MISDRPGVLYAFLYAFLLRFSDSISREIAGRGKVVCMCGKSIRSFEKLLFHNTNLKDVNWQFNFFQFYVVIFFFLCGAGKPQLFELLLRIWFYIRYGVRKLVDLANFSEFFAQRTLVNDAFIIAGCTQSRCSYYGPRCFCWKLRRRWRHGDNLRAFHNFSVIVSLTRYLEGNYRVSNVGLWVEILTELWRNFGFFGFFFSAELRADRIVFLEFIS